MTRFTICRQAGETHAALVTAHAENGRTDYAGVTCVLIHVDAARATRRITLMRGAEAVAVCEGQFTWGYARSGGGEVSGLVRISAYDSRAVKPGLPL